MYNDAGVRTGFEVRNSLLSRRSACRLAQEVPGAVITYEEARAAVAARWLTLGLSSEEVFCEFTVDGTRFLIGEPFGDNACYWIVAETPGDTNADLVERVREVFQAA